jgi:DNA replication protein DnaC
VTSNRAIEEWIPLFDDAILAQSALDRLAHNAHQIVMDGPSYRSRQRPGQPHSPEAKPKPIAAPVRRRRQ